MKQKRQLRYSIVLAAVISLLLCSCASVKNETCQENTQAAQSAASQETGLQEFTDSAGRTVMLPAHLNKIAPSGALAQVVLFTLCPDKMCGRAYDVPAEAAACLGPQFTELPLFGQYYGKNASLNMEALLAAGPDVIIDIGQAKKTIAEDMDGLQNQLGIPVIFIEATLPTISETYITLGSLIGDVEQAEKLSNYCKNVLAQSDSIREQLPLEEQKHIYFATGDTGLYTNAEGSIHADVIAQIGAQNAAVSGAMNQGGRTAISFEQLLLWQPDIIIADTEPLYRLITADPLWGQLNAVRSGRVYRIPSVPFGFMGSPPSVNRMIGIRWLGHITYPDDYTGDIREQVSEFFKLFYHFTPDSRQLDSILKDSL